MSEYTDLKLYIRDGEWIGTDEHRTEGFFYQPTVLSAVTAAARIMSEEPFGPVAVLAPSPRSRRPIACRSV